MTRSIWKGPFSRVLSNLKVTDKQLSVQKIWSRCSMILPQHLRKEFQIYNGKTYISLYVTAEMIGHKFGEFAITRKKPSHKIKKKKK